MSLWTFLKRQNCKSGAVAEDNNFSISGGRLLQKTIILAFLVVVFCTIVVVITCVVSCFLYHRQIKMKQRRYQIPKTVSDTGDGGNGAIKGGSCCGRSTNVVCIESTFKNYFWGIIFYVVHGSVFIILWNLFY